jgi:hypothetical protein
MQDASKPIWVNQQPKTITVSTLPSIFVATPVHSECSIHYTQALLKFQQTCLANGVLVSFLFIKIFFSYPR